MQKAVRLNILARNRAAKSSLKWEERRTKEAWKEWHQVTNRQKALQGNFRTEERLARRQDWIAGPLAPNRNSGTERGTYGTVDQSLIQLPTVPESVRGGPRKEGYAVLPDDFRNGFKGRTIVGNVIEQDRVVIVDGPERLRGLIGFVNHVDLEKEEVKLRNINTVDVRFPAAAQPPPDPSNPEPAKYTSVDVPIPMSHVRLVVSITDDFGRTTDAVVRHIHGGPPYVQRPIGSNHPAHTRYITGVYEKVNFDKEGNRLDKDAPEELIHEVRDTPVELYWPPQSFNNTFEHFEGDTQRTNVSRPTWSVSFERSPLGYIGGTPTNIELGDNPYSRAPYLSAIDVKGQSGLQNVQRAGLDGFIDYTKLHVRREKISQGIMNELRGKQRQHRPRHEDPEFVKRSMIEDARAIWYQDRELLTPAAQAAKVAVVNRIMEREKKIEMKSEEIETDIVELTEKIRNLKVNRRRLTYELRNKGSKGQTGDVHSIIAFRPDRRLKKAVLHAVPGPTRAELEKEERQARSVEEIKMKLELLEKTDPEAAREFEESLRLAAEKKAQKAVKKVEQEKKERETQRSRRIVELEA